MVERRTQAERRAESRDRLIRAAIELLAEHGYANTSLAQISRKAGLSRGLLSHHFGSKEACMRAVVERIREVSRTRTMRAVSAGEDAFDALLDSYFGGIARQDPGARAMYVILIEGLTATPGLRAAVAETNAHTRAFIAETVAALFDPPPANPADDPQMQAIATVVEGILRGVSLQWLADPERVDLEAAKETAKTMIRSAVSALEPSRSSGRTG